MRTPIKSAVFMVLLGLQVFAQVPKPKWSLLHRFESGNEMYLDTQLGKFEGYLVIRILKSNPSTKESFVSTIAVDCKTQAASTIQLDVYGSLMAEGDPVRSAMAESGSFQFIPFDKFPMPKEIKFSALCAEACDSRSKVTK